jgi:hypothetical protein
MPNQLPAMVEERIVSFSIAHPALRPPPDATRTQSRAGFVLALVERT